MADDKKDNNLDLDSILSEINSSIKKEVSKAKDTNEKPKTSKAAARNSGDKPKPQRKPKPPKEPKPEPIHKTTINSTFVETAKIIEDTVDRSDEDEFPAGHTVRFIAVTASEVVEDEKPKPQPQETTTSDTQVSPISINDSSQDETDASPISLAAAPKAAPSPDVARENNRHIKKIRKKQQKPRMTRRQKATAILGAIMTIFFIIGITATVYMISNFTGEIINNTSQKDDLAKEIFPFVIVDIPEFDDLSKLDNSAIIASAIWEFIIDEPDKSKFSKDDLGSIYVPSVDIEYYIRRLFGNDIKITHQTVEDSNIMMVYDEANSMYNIESTPKFLPYRPRVDKIVKKDDIYTLTVSYILPDAMWDFPAKNKVEQVDKVMEYVLKKNKNSYQVLSVKLISVTDSVSSLSQNESNPIITDDYNDPAAEPNPNDTPQAPAADGSQPTNATPATDGASNKSDSSSDASNQAESNTDDNSPN